MTVTVYREIEILSPHEIVFRGERYTKNSVAYPEMFDAQGDTLEQMRDILLNSKSGRRFWAKNGDLKLVWVSEADFFASFTKRG